MQEGRLRCIFHHAERVRKTRLRSGVNGAVQRGEKLDKVYSVRIGLR